MTDSGPRVIGWRVAMERALYGTDGFFVTGTGPARHFRTSVHAGPVFAGAMLRLLAAVDSALGRPAELAVVDVGAGRGELLGALAATAPDSMRSRLRLTAVERAPRPPGVPADIAWRPDPPDRITGLLLATEWLDNVPVDVAEVYPDGLVRRVLVDPTGGETAGPPVTGPDGAWLDRWWPLAGAPPGSRAEIGRPRDEAWAAATAKVDRGLALAVDYGHLRAGRPPAGTLTGYREGRQVPPVPDGGCDLTAHVAMDAVAAAGGTPYHLLTQREALRALGVDGARPPLARARTDPAAYLRALAAAGAAAELTDPAGLGGHWWLLRPVGVELRLDARPVGVDAYDARHG